MYFCAFWEQILVKKKLVAKENIVEFVTSDIFKLHMSKKADRLVQECSKFIFKCFTPQIVPNGTMREE